MRKTNSIDKADSENGVDQQRYIDAFLVDNIELEKLTARLSQFNLFHVLRAERIEIRHSNILAWLLNPKESHGFDDRFVRRFLSRLLLENESIDVSLTPAQIELMTLDDIEVAREWKNIDVFVKSDSNKFCLLIENKIKSREAVGQLLRYKSTIDEEYKEYQVIPILLTLDGDDPSEEAQEAGFVGISHIHVLELLNTLMEQYSSRVPDDVQVLLAHYIDTLRRLTMQDDELVDLCKAIYRKHREAIDLIVQYGAASKILDVCQETVNKIIVPHFSHISRNRVWFVTKEMAKVQNPVLSGWPFLPERYPIVWWFFYGKERGSMQIKLEVGPIDDSALRIHLLKFLEKSGVNIREKGFREEAKYTRIYSSSKKLKTDEEGEVDDSEEYIREVTESIWKKAYEETSYIFEALRKFNWK